MFCPEVKAMYINRTAEQMIKTVAESFPCIVIYGPRQVGKSTTVDHIFGPDYRAVTLDDQDDRLLAETNPRLFLESYGWPLIIDEIQKVPKLLDEIKINIDRQKLLWLKEGGKRTLMYVLTGSNRFELQQGISDSLAGRCGVIEMSSFTASEKQNRTEELFTPDISSLLQKEQSAINLYQTREEVFAEIFKGGMPDICTGEASWETYFKSYVATYIEKDVRKLINASSELQFRNFISLVALRTAQELHFDEIAGNAGIDVRTCKKWISILETSGIVYLLQPYMANSSSRIIKAPKLYFMDTGLCAYLCKWPNAAMLASCAMSGTFFETYIVSELVKNAYAFNLNPKDFLFYYRDIDRKEIDILYVAQNKIIPIEIKSGIAPVKATKNFTVLSKYHMEIGTGLVIDNCEKIRAINEGAYYVPTWLIP